MQKDLRDMGLETLADFEASFIQSLAFSVVLLTLGLGFKHTAKVAATHRDRGSPLVLIDVLAAYISLVAFLFGCVAVYGYIARRGYAASAWGPEARIRGCYAGLGVLLLLAECAVTVTMFVRRPFRPAQV